MLIITFKLGWLCDLHSTAQHSTAQHAQHHNQKAWPVLAHQAGGVTCTRSTAQHAQHPFRKENSAPFDNPSLPLCLSDGQRAAAEMKGQSVNAGKHAHQVLH